MSAWHWFDITGDDDLKVRSGADATASTGPPPDPPDPAPAYTIVRDFRFQASSVSSTVANYPVYCKIDDAIMLQSLNSGLDVRITLDDTDGAAVAWDLINFSGQVWEAWVRIPSITTSGVTMAVQVGRAADDQSFASGTWSGWLAAWDGDGTDRTGNGRSITGASAGTGAVDATSLDGTEYLSSPTFNWLAGHSALGIRTLVRATAGMVGSNRGWLCQGPVGAGGGGFTVVNRWRPLASSGSATNCFFAFIRTSEGGALYNSASDFHSEGLHLYHTSWTSGGAPIVHIDGYPRTASSSQSAGGTTVVDASAGGFDAVLAVGAGSTDTTAHWQDRTAAVAIRNTAISDAEAELDARTLWVSPEWTPFQVADSNGIFPSPVTAPDITPDEPTPPDPEEPSTGTPLPTPLRTVNVSNNSELVAAISAAIPGDEIVLASGTYNPSQILVTADGTETNPIVIRSSTLLGASIGRDRLVPQGDYQIYYGLDFTNSGTFAPGFGVSSPILNTKVWRCRFSGVSSLNSQIMLRVYVTNGCDIAYCTFRQHAGRGISVQPTGATNYTIRRNHFEPQPVTAPLNGTEAIQIFGIVNGTANYFHNGLIEENYIDSYRNDDETISVKMPGVTVRRNTMIDSALLANRHGAPNRYESNILIRCLGIDNYDGTASQWGNVWLNNLLTDCSGNIDIMAGSQDILGTQGGSLYSRSQYTVFAGNTSNITMIVGRAPSWADDFPANQIRIRQHSGSITEGFVTNLDRAEGTTETLFTWSNRVTLTTADVGVNGT